MIIVIELEGSCSSLPVVLTLSYIYLQTQACTHTGCQESQRGLLVSHTDDLTSRLLACFLHLWTSSFTGLFHHCGCGSGKRWGVSCPSPPRVSLSCFSGFLLFLNWDTRPFQSLSIFLYFHLTNCLQWISQSLNINLSVWGSDLDYLCLRITLHTSLLVWEQGCWYGNRGKKMLSRICSHFKHSQRPGSKWPPLVCAGAFCLQLGLLP